jgi:hypothetical protein
MNFSLSPTFTRANLCYLQDNDREIAQEIIKAKEKNGGNGASEKEITHLVKMCITRECGGQSGKAWFRHMLVRFGLSGDSGVDIVRRTASELSNVMGSKSDINRVAKKVCSGEENIGALIGALRSFGVNKPEDVVKLLAHVLKVDENDCGDLLKIALKKPSTFQKGVKIPGDNKGLAIFGALAGLFLEGVSVEILPHYENGRFCNDKIDLRLKKGKSGIKDCREDLFEKRGAVGRDPKFTEIAKLPDNVKKELNWSHIVALPTASAPQPKPASTPGANRGVASSVAAKPAVKAAVQQQRRKDPPAQNQIIRQPAVQQNKGESQKDDAAKKAPFRLSRPSDGWTAGPSNPREIRVSNPTFDSLRKSYSPSSMPPKFDPQKKSPEAGADAPRDQLNRSYASLSTAPKPDPQKESSEQKKPKDYNDLMAEARRMRRDGSFRN